MKSRKSWRQRGERTAERKQQAWNTDRSSKLGSECKEARRVRRESVQPGFHVAASSKKKVKTLHLLGSCFIIPGIDYSCLIYVSERFPSRRTFHSVCKWCARSGGAKEPDDHSSDIFTSSSTEEDAE